MFVDNGKTGVRDRPGLQAVRRYVENGRINIVLAEDASRLFRDANMFADFQRFCDAHGAQIAYVHEPVNLGEALRELLKVSAGRR